MRKKNPLARLVICIVIGTIGGELLFLYKSYRIHGYWNFFEPHRDIPALLGLIFVVALVMYLVKNYPKEE